MPMTRHCFVFPGQGAQRATMGKQVALAHPDTAGMVFATADAILGFSISQLCFDGSDQELSETEITQPAIFTTSVAILSVLRSKSVHPAAVAGHSVGEYAALVAAEAIRFEDALPVVRRRGELMAAAASKTPGAMAAIIGLESAEVEAVCQEAQRDGVAEPSNINGTRQIVISGETKAVQTAMRLAKERGAKAIQLKVSAPFHCSLMAPIQAEFKSALDALDIQSPRVPVIANATGGYVTSAAEVRQALIDQLASPVRWTATINLLLATANPSFLEIGPGKVLSGLIRAIDPNARTHPVATPDDIEQVVAE